MCKCRPMFIRTCMLVLGGETYKRSKDPQFFSWGEVENFFCDRPTYKQADNKAEAVKQADRQTH